MYPTLPANIRDLGPLPECDGPKLDPFDFGGPQNIQFVEKIGRGAHSTVFKVKINRQIYALKLFSFPGDGQWKTPREDLLIYKESVMKYFANHNDPFNAECRAYGRLREAKREDLSIKCHGYVLLDEAHTRKAAKCAGAKLETMDEAKNVIPDDDLAWLRFAQTGADGKKIRPPFRGLIKDLGTSVKNATRTRPRGANVFNEQLLDKLLADIESFHQLGIIGLDVAYRQILNGMWCDFSYSMTTPHFEITSDGNPDISDRRLKACEHDLFRMTIYDYWNFESMLKTWNEERQGKEAAQVDTTAFNDRLPLWNEGSPGSAGRYYTMVDPRRYDHEAGKRAAPAPLSANPPRWYHSCDGEFDKELEAEREEMDILGDKDAVYWGWQDGLPYPRHEKFPGPDSDAECDGEDSKEGDDDDDDEDDDDEDEDNEDEDNDDREMREGGQDGDVEMGEDMEDDDVEMGEGGEDGGEGGQAGPGGRGAVGRQRTRAASEEDVTDEEEEDDGKKDAAEDSEYEEGWSDFDDLSNCEYYYSDEDETDL